MESCLDTNVGNDYDYEICDIGMIYNPDCIHPEALKEANIIHALCLPNL